MRPLPALLLVLVATGRPCPAAESDAPLPAGIKAVWDLEKIGRAHV
jgi:hypothetical protein